MSTDKILVFNNNFLFKELVCNSQMNKQSVIHFLKKNIPNGEISNLRYEGVCFQLGNTIDDLCFIELVWKCDIRIKLKQD